MKEVVRGVPYLSCRWWGWSRLPDQTLLSLSSCRLISCCTCSGVGSCEEKGGRSSVIVLVIWRVETGRQTWSRQEREERETRRERLTSFSCTRWTCHWVLSQSQTTHNLDSSSTSTSHHTPPEETTTMMSSLHHKIDRNYVDDDVIITLSQLRHNYLDPTGFSLVVAANAAWSEDPLCLLQQLTRNTAHSLLFEKKQTTIRINSSNHQH